MFFFLFVKSVHIYIFTDKKYKESWIINNTEQFNHIVTVHLVHRITVLKIIRNNSLYAYPDHKLLWFHHCSLLIEHSEPLSQTW